ncbi:MAG TPA: nuclear transport factor 2 family protein [Lichenihabitans sp.]|jgi:ketosteroid isomerase-like protein|nr:nuclear transport factor 2 family protein [Lichenihabitans sp.]
MPASHDDIVWIENATASLADRLNQGDISSLSDLFDETTLLMPPARRTAKAAGATELLRNMAVGNEGIRLHSTQLEELGDGLVRDVGTLSLRRRQKPEERMNYRYLMVWRKSGAAWKLTTMMWNRSNTDGASGQGRAGQQQAEA